MLIPMERYKNLGRDSRVHYYQIEDTSIEVKFDSSKPYTYSYKKAGKSHVENMKILATRGSGLNSYINKYVKNLYD
jgi:hypothetical protein